MWPIFVNIPIINLKQQIIVLVDYGIEFASAIMILFVIFLLVSWADDLHIFIRLGILTSKYSFSISTRTTMEQFIKASLEKIVSMRIKNVDEMLLSKFF